MSEEIKCNKCGFVLTGVLDKAFQRHADYNYCIENLVKQLVQNDKRIERLKKEVERYKAAIWHYRTVMESQQNRGFPPGETAWAMNLDLEEVQDLIKEHNP